MRDGSVIPPHAHHWPQLIYAARGVLTVWTEVGSWIVPPNAAVWAPAGIRHGIRVSVVNPGYTASEFRSAMKVHGRSRSARAGAMSSKAVACEVVACLGRTRRNVVLTAVGWLGLAARALAPGLLDWATARNFRREIEGERE